jgi:hypothetical protein
MNSIILVHPLEIMKNPLGGEQHNSDDGYVATNS